ncbi:Lon protease mitochondrial [Spathaspora sp. JA1]|nr:Lon protease mitochondrial [Spathaspora sp. JA1]
MIRCGSKFRQVVTRKYQLNCSLVSLRTATTYVRSANQLPISYTFPQILPSINSESRIIIPDNIHSILFDTPEKQEEQPPPQEDSDKKPKKERAPRKKKEKSDDVDDKSTSVESKQTIDPNSPAGSTPASAGAPSVPPSSAPPPDHNNNFDKDPEDQSIPTPDLNEETGLYPPLIAIRMTHRPPLPGTNFAFTATDPEMLRALDTAIERREPYFVAFLSRNSDLPDQDNIDNKESVHDVGVLCQLVTTSADLGKLSIVGFAHKRVKISTLFPANNKEEVDGGELANSFLKDFNISTAVVEPVEDNPFTKTSTDIELLVDEMKRTIAELQRTNPDAKASLNLTKDIFEDPSLFADCIAGRVHIPPNKAQGILETLDVKYKLIKVTELAKIELEASRVKLGAIRELSKRAEKNHTNAFIKEYIVELRKQIGDSSNNKSQKFEERIKQNKLKLTDEANEAYNTEKEKLAIAGPGDMESSMHERYLDWLTSIPWGVYSKDSFNIKKSKEILERDHYGLKDVKERILEFISRGKVSGNIEGKILCLTGPPGTGKTSIAKSIAESLNRSYVRIALGGLHDVHELKGHRRTYVGSIPGRIIYALKQAKTSNPLMLLDEIDKLDLNSRSGGGGGGAAALLEILDPEQNNGFVDNFIEVKVDLSKILFVCTSNYIENIPAPLRDRMEIIDVSGYTKNEKIEIATKYLVPKESKKVGLDKDKVVIPRETIDRMIDKYCRESGVRNVKSLISRIFNKATLKIVEQIEEREEKSVKEAVKEEVKNVEEIVVEPKLEETEVKTEQSKGEQNKSEQSAEPSKEAIETVDTTTREKLIIPEDIKLEITPENLKDYIGPEIYTRERVYQTLPPGVASGLAFTSSGNGEVLYIESILTNSISSGTGHAGIRVTGRLSEVMKESASIAHAFAKQYIVKEFPENRFFEVGEIHLHCPGGAVPKDGPSAGVAFTSCLMSLALQRSIPANIAMTGEITVTGKVLPVGGLKEKTLGAKRYGCDTIIYPKDIQNELEEMPEEVKEGVKFIPVEWYQEVFDVLFPGLTKQEGNDVWKDEFKKLEENKKKKKKEEEK